VATSFIPIGSAFLIALIAFIMVNLLYVYLVLAPNNVFFTFVPTETVKFVVSGGQLVTIFCSSLNYALDSLYNIVDEATGEFPDDDYGVKDLLLYQCKIKKEDLEKKTDKEKEAINSIIEKEAKKILDKEKGTVRTGFSLLKYKGLHFYGIWPMRQILEWNFRWSSIRENNEIISRQEAIENMILRSDFYASTLSEAEDKNLIPLNILFSVEILIRNPARALFAVQNWLEASHLIVKTEIRNSLREKVYELLVADEKCLQALGEEIYQRAKERGSIWKMRKDYGVYVKGIRIERIDPLPEYRDITLKQVISQKQADADKITAVKKAEIIEVIAEAYRRNKIDPEMMAFLQEHEGEIKLVNVGDLKGVMNFFKTSK